MGSAREQMKLIQAELQSIRDKIATLRIEEAVLVRLQASLSGEPEPSAQPTRKRSVNIKPLVLDIMNEANTSGATSAEVFDLVLKKAPAVSRDTTGSILSRLKADGALSYDGSRYYDARYTPKPPFEGIRVVGS